jgi:hypothetical protein
MCRVKIDSLYREDQFYYLPIIHYNRRQEYHKIKFSAGFQAVLRDMPINKDRTHAVAVGLGITYNNYIQNLAIRNGELHILLLTEKQYLIK